MVRMVVLFFESHCYMLQVSSYAFCLFSTVEWKCQHKTVSWVWFSVLKVIFFIKQLLYYPFFQMMRACWTCSTGIIYTTKSSHLELFVGWTVNLTGHSWVTRDTFYSHISILLFKIKVIWYKWHFVLWCSMYVSVNTIKLKNQILILSFHMNVLKKTNKCLQCTTNAYELALPFQYLWRWPYNISYYSFLMVPSARTFTTTPYLLPQRPEN